MPRVGQASGYLVRAMTKWNVCTDHWKDISGHRRLNSGVYVTGESDDELMLSHNQLEVGRSL